MDARNRADVILVEGSPGSKNDMLDLYNNKIMSLVKEIEEHCATLGMSYIMSFQIGDSNDESSEPCECIVSTGMSDGAVLPMQMAATILTCEPVQVMIPDIGPGHINSIGTDPSEHGHAGMGPLGSPENLEVPSMFFRARPQDRRFDD